VPAGSPGTAESPSGISQSPKTSEQTGIIKGKVIVGPICPVERLDEPCELAPEVYTTREIAVYHGTGYVGGGTRNGGGAESVALYIDKMYFNEDGSYKFELPPGEYMLDIIKSGIDRSPELPQPITIELDKTKIFDFNIDTGIR